MDNKEREELLHAKQTKTKRTPKSATETTPITTPNTVPIAKPVSAGSLTTEEIIALAESQVATDNNAQTNQNIFAKRQAENKIMQDKTSLFIALALSILSFPVTWWASVWLGLVFAGGAFGGSIGGLIRLKGGFKTLAIITLILSTLGILFAIFGWIAIIGII